ncbi:MAG: hypothetical protein GY811_08210, partial [Myxococcales bacterium]|nr:hypothetical protein [Myxococcales bacterium]
GGNADAAEIDCLPSIALSDTFEGMTLDAQWTKDSAPGTSLDVSGGVLVLTPSSANQGRYAAARSEAFDFNNKRVAIEIAQMLNTQAAGIAELQVGLDDQNLYFLRQTGGVMQFGTTVAGTSQVRATAGFSVALHRWWQFRVLGGWIYADTSPDGQNWTELSSVELDGPVEFEVSIRAGTDRRINEPGSLHIDNVNSGSSLCQ